MAKHAVLSSGAKMWRSLACAKSELRLDLTLACGQSFRWRETAEGHWTGVMAGRLWTLTQTDDTLWYHVYKNQDRQGEAGDRKGRAGVSLQMENKSEKRFKGAVKKEEEEPVAVTSVQDTEEEEEMLRDYFQLNVKLGDLYKEWGVADPHFKRIADIFTGVRMLRQDPTECLFSFICTSNNHISRIQGMVERLCQSLGAPLCQLDQTSYHDFPSLSALADNSVEACLRDLGFGYRARFLQQSAKQILETHGLQWLEGLRSTPYLQARDALRTLPGVGTKVADCVCLMSLDKAEAVPIDTHVWQIAKRDYGYASGNGQKSITDKLHRDIGRRSRQSPSTEAKTCTAVDRAAFSDGELKSYRSLQSHQTPLNKTAILSLSRESGGIGESDITSVSRRNTLLSCRESCLLFQTGGVLTAIYWDFFRKLWGPYAGWAQSVLFCADLKKFQKLKEMPQLKQPQKRENGEEEMRVTCKKTKIKTEENETVKTIKTKSACHKKAKMSV